MSLLPLLYSNWWEDLDSPHSLLDQHFGQEISPEHLLCTLGSLGRRESPLAPRLALRRGVPANLYLRPWADSFRRSEGGGASVVKADKNRFRVTLDVQQFAPEEISVKVVDGSVIVEGKHEEKQDEHGWVSRQFVRRYIVPEQCNIDQVASKLSSDGILSIEVPRKETPKTDNESNHDRAHGKTCRTRDWRGEEEATGIEGGRKKIERNSTL